MVRTLDAPSCMSHIRAVLSLEPAVGGEIERVDLLLVSVEDAFCRYPQVISVSRCGAIND